MKNMPQRNASRLAAVASFLLLMSLLALSGCATAADQNNPPPLPQARVIDPPPGADLLAANTYAGDAIANILLKRMSAGRSILTTSMVDMDKMDKSSALGRVSMQQLGSRVAQHGFRVIDVHLTEAMIVNENGEFMLSRDICKILATQHDAYAVLVGVYTPTDSKIYVSVRALRLSDAAVIAAYEYYLPRSGETYELLGSANGGRGGSVDPTWNRYAARGQAFANCTPQKGASAAVSEVRTPAPTAVAPAPVAVQSAPKAPAPKPKATPTRRSAPKRSASPRRAPSGYYSQQPAPQQAAVYAPASPECPQDVPSNRRAVPDDCNRGGRSATGSQGQTVYGEPYVDRGGGRVVNPSAPAPAVGRAPY